MPRVEVQSPDASSSATPGYLLAVLDGIGDGFYAVDRDWRISMMNVAAETLLGVRRTDVLGRRLWDVFPLGRGTWFEEAARRCMERREPFRAEVPAAREPDRIRDVRIFATPDGVGISLRDVTQARADQAALQKNRDRLRLAQEAGRIGHWELDLATDRLWWSDSQFRLLNIPPSPAGRDRSEFRAMIHPDDRQQAEAATDRAIRDGASIDLEFRVTPPDGRTRWLVSRGEVVRDDEGHPVSIIGINFDVTNRRESEDRQKLLTAEVDHRAKNMLGVVQAILRMSRADSMEEMLEAVEGRVEALSRAHALLAEVSWSGASLAQLAEAGLRIFVGPDRALTVSGPPVTLTPSAVQALTLVFHELGTNAVKYGALSVPGGRVDLLWSRQPGEGLRLRWRESGGPRVAPPTRRGFGSCLIEQSIRHQMGARLSIDWMPDGLLLDAAIPDSCLTATPPPDPAETPGMPEPPTRPGSLSGRRVLVVEDDAVIALELEVRLRSAGCVVVGPAPDLMSGLRLAAAQDLDAAVLDVSLHKENSGAVAQLLRARGIPFLFCTGYGTDSLPGEIARGEPVLRKPLRRGDLEGALGAVLQARTDADAPS